MRKFCIMLVFLLTFLFGCSTKSLPEYESYRFDGDLGTEYRRTYTTLSECDKSIDLGKTDWVVRYSDISYLGEFSKYWIYSYYPDFAGKQEHIVQYFEFNNKNDEPYVLNLLHACDYNGLDADLEWRAMLAKCTSMPQMDNFMRMSDGMKPHRGYYYRDMIYKYGTSGYLLSITWNTGRSICKFQLYDQGYYGFEYDLSDENSIVAQLVDPARADKAVARMTIAVLFPRFRKWLPVILLIIGIGTISIVYYIKRKKHLNHIRQIMAQESSPNAGS